MQIEYCTLVLEIIIVYYCIEYMGNLALTEVKNARWLFFGHLHITTFEESNIFWGNWSNSENFLKSKIKLLNQVKVI